ncbi:hypothetical protein [Chlorobaculum limnaeum]|uniref:hypothetical protein n=1 Tax=Chlorobaculum limnaeum TaxID=274537 RepID=UPI0012EE2A33|nr:hypothetical protein [Chlorobaculum limnaeum]
MLISRGQKEKLHRLAYNCFRFLGIVAAYTVIILTPELITAWPGKNPSGVAGILGFWNFLSLRYTNTCCYRNWTSSFFIFLERQIIDIIISFNHRNIPIAFYGKCLLYDAYSPLLFSDYAVVNEIRN